MRILNYLNKSAVSKGIKPLFLCLSALKKIKSDKNIFIDFINNEFKLDCILFCLLYLQ